VQVVHGIDQYLLPVIAIIVIASAVRWRSSSSAPGAAARPATPAPGLPTAPSLSPTKRG